MPSNKKGKQLTFEFMMVSVCNAPIGGRKDCFRQLSHGPLDTVNSALTGHA